MINNTNGKLVSILLPCYNHEKYLDECIKSIIAQTYKNIEVIIADDCSSDSSFEKLLAWKDKLEKRFSRVVIYQNEHNLGIPANINSLIKQANGVYIKQLATDDMLMENAIEVLAEYADHHDVDIIYSNMAIVNETQQFPLDNDMDMQVERATCPAHKTKSATGSLLMGEFSFGTPGVLIPQKTYAKFGLHDESYIIEDLEYWLRISVNGTFGYLDKLTVLYRVGHESGSHISRGNKRKRYQYFRNILNIKEKYIDYCSPAEKAIIYGRQLVEAADLPGIDAIVEVCKLCNGKKIKIRKRDIIKAFLIKVRLGVILREIRCKIWKRR